MRLVIALLASCAALFCQEFRATISGQVTDTSGGAVVGAQIRAVQRSTNQVIETKSNQQGYYTLTYLQPSTFDIEVTAAGFSKLRNENITLLVAEKLDLPFVLQVGSLIEKVIVSATAEVLDSSDASRGLSFDSRMTSEYALNGRQVYMLMDLTPGVLFTQEQFGSSGFSGTRGWDTNGAYTMNGGVAGTNSFSLNGAPISLTGSWQVAPNVDAIQEFKVQVNTYDAAIGRTGGGSVNTTLKSGSNAIHGTLFDFIRNSVFDANYTQNNQVGAPRGKHITNQFGGTIGGPIKKDKDFVFFSFEGFRERVPFPVVANVPPMDIRGGQNFTKYNVNIFDPLTVHPCVSRVDITGTCASADIRNPFPGNVLPQSRINPIGVKILSYYPAPNTVGTTQNFVASGSTGKYFYDQPIGRWDRVINEKDRVYAMFTFQHGQEYRNQTGIPGDAASGNINSQRTNFNIISSWTRILSPTTIFDIRASFGRFTSWFPDADLTSKLTAKDLGMTNMVHSPTSTLDFPPRFTVDQYATLFGNGANLFTWGTDNQWNVVPTITVSKGKQTFRIGVDLVYAMRGSGSIGQTNGQFGFDRSATRQYPLRGGTVSDGSGLADVLLGAPGTGFIDWNDTYYRTSPYAAIFIQEDWKITRKLTMNLGLRYDVQFPFVERWNRMNTGFDYNAVNPLSDSIIAVWKTNKAAYDANTANIYPFPPVPQAIYGGKTFIKPDSSRRTYDTDWQNIQPRIGIAWGFKRNSVLRTGFGIFHKTATQGGYTDGFSQQTAYQGSLDGGLTPAALTTTPNGPFSLANPFPNGITPPSGSALGLRTNIGNGTSLDGRQRLIPRTFQYSFGLQHRSFWGILFDASYVGSKTNHDVMAYNSDYLSMDTYLAGQQTPAFLTRTVPNPFYNILPRNSTAGASANISAEKLYYSYPVFNNLVINTNPWTNYRYDALQLRVDKRFSGTKAIGGGLTTVFSYTFSKNLQSANRLNNWNLNEDPVHELVSYDKPQNIALSGVWDIPFGKGRYFLNHPNKMLGHVINGWTVNYVYRYTSGNPVAGIDAQSNCSNLLVEEQTKDRWFNNDKSCAFRNRASYTPRVVPDRYAWLRQADNASLNLAGAKTFSISERWKFNLRGEAFNLFNHPLYGAPDTGYTSVRFGMLPLAQQNFPRLIQVSAKLIF